MTKYTLIVLFFIKILFAQDENIKDDNTLIINVDDFAITTQYPNPSTNVSELALIIRNRSKAKYLFILKKNNQNIDSISLPAQESFSKALLLKNKDSYSLRPLSPPAEDIILSNTSIKDI